MLTGLIKERFSRHHEKLLAYMDRLEEVVQEMSETQESSECFLRHQPVLTGIFEFLEAWESQHEREEERILMPLLRRQMEENNQNDSLEALKRISQEHAEGQCLVQSLSATFSDLAARGSREPAEYYKFASDLNELIWHFRRHVWSEDEVILPAAERLIPDSSDRLWAGILATGPVERRDD